MRVAVVIACFNDGRFLEEALQSLAGQEPCELVIVDDGSTDRHTLDFLAAVRESGTKVLTQPNRGPSMARMAGVAATTAPYVHLLDADDRLAPGALETLADTLDSCPEVAAAWGDYRTFGASDCYFPMAPVLDPWRITYLCEIPGTCMVRRAAIEAIGGWRSELAYEDWDFWMRLAAKGETGIGRKQVTLFYREHPTSRRFSQNVSTHAKNYQALREHNRELFLTRPVTRRASATTRALKIALPAIDALPGISEDTKRQLWALARYFFEREMCSDCYQGPLARIRDAIRSRRTDAAFRDEPAP